MIDSRRCARTTAVSGSTSSTTPPASGPRCAMRSIIAVTSTLPSGLLVAASDSAHVRPPAGPRRACRGPRGRRARRRPRGSPRCWCCQASSCSTRSRPRRPISLRRARRRGARRSPGRTPRRRSAPRRRAASPADTRVSRRSKATTGRPKAMYSIVLFIVETSLSGFLRVGAQADVGGREDLGARIRPAPGRAARRSPVSPSSSRSGDQVVVAVARAHEREGDVVAPEVVDDDVGGAERRGRRRPAGP